MMVWTVRHPPVDRQGRCVGQSTVAVTTPLHEAVREVVDAAPFSPTRLISSDLPRCARLAEGLAMRWGIPLETTASLREVNFGEWEGRTYDEIDSTDGLRWRTWCENWRYQAPPSGESLRDLEARILTWLERHPPTPTEVLITHAGVIRTLRVLTGETWDEAMATECPYLGWERHNWPGLDRHRHH